MERETENERKWIQLGGGVVSQMRYSVDAAARMMDYPYHVAAVQQTSGTVVAC